MMLRGNDVSRSWTALGGSCPGSGSLYDRVGKDERIHSSVLENDRKAEASVPYFFGIAAERLSWKEDPVLRISPDFRRLPLSSSAINGSSMQSRAMMMGRISQKYRVFVRRQANVSQCRHVQSIENGATLGKRNIDGLNRLHGKGFPRALFVRWGSPRQLTEE